MTSIEFDIIISFRFLLILLGRGRLDFDGSKREWHEFRRLPCFLLVARLVSLSSEEFEGQGSCDEGVTIDLR